MPKSATKPNRLREAHERLTQAVESIVSGDDWKRMLEVARKFHRYSFNNQLLVFMQKPDATLVAGFNKWKSLGRSVKRGEKGIAIMAPCKYKVKVEDEHGDEQAVQQLRGFRIVHVFDVTQTDGDPIEDLEAIRPKLLDGDAPEGIWDALVAQADAAGFEVIRNRRGSENGYCDFSKQTIGVRPDVSQAQAVKTLIHELGHALLHAEEAPTDRARHEVEVESAAFIVCHALNVSTDAYSFPYVARWSSGDLDLVRESATRSVECAQRILNGIDSRPSPA